jgi:hypothetical protein
MGLSRAIARWANWTADLSTSAGSGTWGLKLDNPTGGINAPGLGFEYARIPWRLMSASRLPQSRPRRFTRVLFCRWSICGR